MLEQLSKFVPVAATEAAQGWDMLFLFLFGVSVVFFLLVMIPMLYFMIRYRKSKQKKAGKLDHNMTIEVVWTAIPFFVLMAIFAWGAIAYKNLEMNIPSNAMEVRVIATGAWKWKFQYSDGWIENDDLIVPADTPIKLVLTAEPGTEGQPGSSSMIHSFFVPNFRLKKDAVPGIYNYSWFKTPMVGKHIFFCAEYCGSQHSQMYGRIIVLNNEDWKLWQWKRADDPNIKEKIASDLDWVGIGAEAERYRNLQASIDREKELAKMKKELSSSTVALVDPHKDLIESGRKLASSMGCSACHSTDGSAKIGPTYKGLYQTERELSDGRHVLADENYLRESIENPQAKIVAGYTSVVMPPYPGQLSETDLSALIAYLKSMK